MRPNSLPCPRFFVAAVLASFGASSSADDAVPNPLAPVPFVHVRLDDAFWTPRLKTNREASLPHNFEWCEKTGRFSNFDKAAGRVQGDFEGIYYNDSDVYKVLEGAAYSLADYPDPDLSRRVDEVIDKIAAAQRENGYLNTYHTLAKPEEKWSDIRNRHELYCAGHLFEAAVAHHQATGKRTLLDVALKFADHISDVFGPGKRLDVPGHEEIELALVKLYHLTGDKRSLDLARFFLDLRGDASRRTLYGEYYQDHEPIRRQNEIVGHAVRAMYLYAGVADVAAATGDSELLATMDRIWDDVVLHKMYVTGGIGARHQGEAFGDRYELPNDSAYAETCAAIGMILWNHRLHLLHADARYADIMERVLYNGFLSGVSLDGKRFFYVNPLASKGKHHRQPFYACACCPTNVVRVLPSLPGYVYSHAADRIFVNLYVAGNATVPVGDGKVAIEQETRYPWDGEIRLVLEPTSPTDFELNLRLPSWCDDPRIAVNGRPVESFEPAKGYARLRRVWRSGDTIDLNLPMSVERIESHPRVAANQGRVALQRGPVVYCFEGVDNGGQVDGIVLPARPEFAAEFHADLLGGVVVVKTHASDGRPIVAVPYHVWDHRDSGPMAVWVRQEDKPTDPDPNDPSWHGKLYRPYKPAPATHR